MAKKFNVSGSAPVKGMVANDNSKHANLPTDSFMKPYRATKYNSENIGDELGNVYDQMDTDVEVAKKDQNLLKV